MPVGLVRFALAMVRELLVRKQIAPQSHDRLDLVVDAVAKFFGSIYLHGLYKTAAPGSLAVAFKHGTEHSRAIVRAHGLQANGYTEFSAQALFEDDSFPDAIVEFSAGGETAEFPLVALARYVRDAGPRPLFHRFVELVEAKRAANGKVTVLDLGGRSGSTARDFPDWNVTVLDIAAAPGVDVVADAHEMSATLGLGAYDAALSVSVYEHLLMPWKAMIELGRVLKIGGIAMIHTHQTIGMHEMPWDFYRFSDKAWAGLLNRSTGFEIIDTQMTDYVHIIPRLYDPRFADAEKAGGFLCSGVLARKICEPTVDWSVSLTDILDTSYPVKQA